MMSVHAVPPQHLVHAWHTTDSKYLLDEKGLCQFTHSRAHKLHQLQLSLSLPTWRVLTVTLQEQIIPRETNN